MSVCHSTVWRHQGNHLVLPQLPREPCGAATGQVMGREAQLR